MDESRGIVATCSCKREYTDAQWRALPVLGEQADPFVAVHMRHCPNCQSSVSRTFCRGCSKETGDDDGLCSCGWTGTLTERINAGEFRRKVMYPLGKKGSDDPEGRAAWKADGQRIDALFRYACEYEFDTCDILPVRVRDALWREAKWEDGLSHHDIAGYYETLSEMVLEAFHAGAEAAR